MSEPEKKKELSSEMRILVASILSMAVILLWVKFFAPKPPAQPASNQQTGELQRQRRMARESIPAGSAITPATSGTNEQTSRGSATAIAPTPAVVVPVKADTQERTIVVENSLYRVEISNRGGVVKSWQLKKYKDDAKPPRVLDVVHPEASAQVGGWPFAVVLDDPQLEAQANSALYVAGVAEPAVHGGKAATQYEAPSGKTAGSSYGIATELERWTPRGYEDISIRSFLRGARGNCRSSSTARLSTPAWPGWEDSAI